MCPFKQLQPPYMVRKRDFLRHITLNFFKIRDLKNSRFSRHFRDDNFGPVTEQPTSGPITANNSDGFLNEAISFFSLNAVIDPLGKDLLIAMAISSNTIWISKLIPPAEISMT